MALFARMRWKRAIAAARGKVPVALLDTYAKADWPDDSTPLDDVRFLALDFETDGMKADAALLQAGWLPFEGRSIGLAGAVNHDIACDRRLADEAVVVHGIGETRAAQGMPEAEVVKALVEALAGRVLLAHFASFEVRMLQAAMRRQWGAKLPIRSLCTLELERRISPGLLEEGAYRLGTARTRHGLPDYGQHEALADALAAAELYLAQRARMHADATLGSVSSVSY